MKHLLKIAFALVLLSVPFACTKEEAQVSPFLEVTTNNISGTWTLSEWNGKPLSEGLFFYIEIVRRDKLFTTYENITGSSTVTVTRTGRYDLYDGDIITGIYDNSLNEYWMHKYVISELTGDRMVWTATDDPDEVMVYVRCDSVPEDILGEE